MHFKDEPRVVKLRTDVLKYNRLVRDLGLRDHQVPRAQKASWKTAGLLTYRIGLLIVWTILALPGTVLNSPMFILASIMSRKKAKGLSVILYMRYQAHTHQLPRGARSLHRKSCRSRCSCDLESAYISWSGTSGIRLLCFPLDSHRPQSGNATQMAIMDALLDTYSIACDELCFSQIRRGWNGRPEVSEFPLRLRL